MPREKPHDRLVKAVFGRVEGARALLYAALPSRVTGEFDFDSLRLEGTNVVSRSLRERYADLLFSVAHRNDRVLVLFLLEHKSASERFTLLDIFETIGLLWADWRRKHPRDEFVPRIIPILIHHGSHGSHGSGRWRCPRSIRELLFGCVGENDPLAMLDPVLPIVLFDLVEHDDRAITSVAERDPLAGAALFLLRWSRAKDFLARLGRRIDLLQRVRRTPGGDRPFELLIQYTLLVASPESDLDAFARLVGEEIDMSAEKVVRSLGEELIAKGIRIGIEKGIEKGIERGVRRGQREARIRAVIDVLIARFGAVPDELARDVSRIDQLESLDRLLARAATAADLPAFVAGIHAERR